MTAAEFRILRHSNLHSILMSDCPKKMPRQATPLCKRLHFTMGPRSLKLIFHPEFLQLCTMQCRLQPNCPSQFPRLTTKSCLWSITSAICSKHQRRFGINEGQHFLVDHSAPRINSSFVCTYKKTDLHYHSYTCTFISSDAHLLTDCELLTCRPTPLSPWPRVRYVSSFHLSTMKIH